MRPFNFRCCEEEDVLDIYALVNPNRENDLLTPQQLEQEITDGINQWHCVEMSDSDVVLAVSRLVVEKDEDRNLRRGVVNVVATAKELELQDELLSNLLSFLVATLKQTCVNIGLDEMVVEVFEDNDVLIALLEDNSFTETGGQLCDKKNIYKFKYSQSLKKDLKELDSRIAASPSEEVLDIEFPDSIETLEFEEIGGDLAQAPNDENMQNLIERLFSALHSSADSLVPERNGGNA